MKDPLFGDIQYNLGWNGECSWFIFGKTITTLLSIDCFEPDNEIESYQRDAFSEFLGHMDLFTHDAEEGIFNYYEEILPDYRERFGESADQWAPLVSTIEEVGLLVKPTTVYVPISFSEPKERVIGLLFDCTWDTSLGLAAKFVDGCLREVGVQDIVL